MKCNERQVSQHTVANTRCLDVLFVVVTVQGIGNGSYSRL